MKMIILGLTTSYEIYFCANFITSNGFVCKNEGERLLVVCLNVKYFWFESAGIDLKFKCSSVFKENQLYKIN